VLPARLTLDEQHKDLLLRCLISAFIIIHFSLTMVWLLPQTPLRRNIIDSCRYTWAFFGFDQRWELFAPNTREVNCHAVMLITYKNGNTTLWPVPRMDLADYVQKFSRDKFRKWGTDNLPWEDHREYWPDFARYTGRIHYEENNPPVTAVFVVYQSKIPNPDTSFTRQDRLPVRNQWRTGFCYRFKPEDYR
jgi:hypothetical protein